MTRNGNQGYIVLNVLTVLNRRDVTFNTDNTYLIYKRGFLRSMVMYLKDLSPYHR